MSYLCKQCNNEMELRISKSEQNYNKTYTICMNCTNKKGEHGLFGYFLKNVPPLDQKDSIMRSDFDPPGAQQQPAAKKPMPNVFQQMQVANKQQQPSNNILSEIQQSQQINFGVLLDTLQRIEKRVTEVHEILLSYDNNTTKLDNSE